jgi:Imidazolonepropionase and related amidohydrolases
LAGVPDRLILWTAADSKAAAHFLKDRGDAAESLGALHRTGTIEVGKAADLVLLDANPLTDIHNTKTIRAVFVNGRYLDRASLDGLLADLERGGR